MFEQEPETMTEHDYFSNVGLFGGDGGFIASREITSGAPLDAGFTFDMGVNVAMVLVVTVTT